MKGKVWASWARDVSPVAHNHYGWSNAALWGHAGSVSRGGFGVVCKPAPQVAILV